MNGLVERSHQTIMQMIEKMGEDEKANWPSHLMEIVHACNTTQSAVMGYSPCYLMFGHWPRLPVNFYFPTLRSVEGPGRGMSTSCVNEYVATVRDCLRDCSSRGPSPVYGRGSETEVVLQLENMCHRFETWQYQPSQGRCLSIEEEDQGQMGVQAL